jgi:GH15 family glucan-1,4-alpha-glucosidase
MKSDRPQNPVPGREIGNHGIIGNLDTVALVALDGTIDFLCWPHLDSPTIFAGLLDPQKGGAFELEPHLDAARAMQLYVPETNVLMTRWLSEAGSVECVDLMPHPETSGTAHKCLIRRVRATRGDVEIAVRVSPRFDYARETPSAERVEGGVLFCGRSLKLQLTTPVPLRAENGDAHGRFKLKHGEETWFVLADADQKPVSSDDMGASIDKTVAAWRAWSSRCVYEGRWREQVLRSALTLKLLTSHEHGSIAAAATFGLPEATAAGRNWDYRATWIRDASFTIYAFMRLGQVGEAEHFRQWIADVTRKKAQGEQLHIMYAIDGTETPDETTLDHLTGYGGSQPVRIGNAAHRQQQIDIFGEIIDAFYLANKYGRAISRFGWEALQEIINYVCQNWRRADAGIWEIRDEPREFLHSRLMCWVALDRAVRLAYKRSLPAPMAKWTHERDLIAEDIWVNFRHPTKGYFVQSKGSEDVDAALLMMPLMRFISSTDPVWLATMDAIREELSDDGMIFRYRNADGLKGGEGAFTPCTFWYVECLARAGRVEEAELHMEKGLRYANHLGLFSEELDRRGLALGNFPQALTHLAFISAAHFLDRRLSRGGPGTWQP